MKAETNGLKYTYQPTKPEEVTISSDHDILAHAPDNAWFIAYLFHRVVIGRFKNKQFVYHEQGNNDVILDNILKLRVFNEDAELFVWKTGRGHKARLRTDGQGSEQGIVDANQVLFGTKSEPLGNGYLKLTEDRGTEIILPADAVPISVDEINKQGKRLVVHTRSYIGYIEKTGQASYEDVRFVKFEKYQEDKK